MCLWFDCSEPKRNFSAQSVFTTSTGCCCSQGWVQLPSGVLATDYSWGSLRLWVKLLEASAGTASACRTLSAFIWKHNEWEPKVLLHPAYVRVTILTLRNRCSCLVLFAQWCCDLKNPKLCYAVTPADGKFVEVWAKVPFIYLLALEFHHWRHKKSSGKT